MSAAAKILRLKRVDGKVYYRQGSEEATLRRANAVLREGFTLGSVNSISLTLARSAKKRLGASARQRTRRGTG